jgi:hypothetical protein
MSAHRDALNADELSLKIRLSVFQQHPNHLAQVLDQFLDRLALRMSTGEAGNVARARARWRRSRRSPPTGKAATSAHFGDPSGSLARR